MSSGDDAFRERVRDRTNSFMLGALVGGLLFGSLAVAFMLMFAIPPEPAEQPTSANVQPALPSEPIRIIVEISADMPTELYEVTAYTAGAESTGKSPDHPLYGVTASGEYVKEGVTAACPPDLPFGTRVYIPYFAARAGDDGVRVCEDRGSAITDGKLDVYMTELDDALTFGRRELEVVILGGEVSE